MGMLLSNNLIKQAEESNDTKLSEAIYRLQRIGHSYHANINDCENPHYYKPKREKSKKDVF